MKQTFNPDDWLDENEEDEHKPSNPRTDVACNGSTADDIERIVSRIESAHTDITGSYTDWRNLGFALADELGERGRDYFHRLSRFYSKYSHTSCDKQYDHCLKAKGHGITIGTLFHMAKGAGITGAAVFNRNSNMEQDAVEKRSSCFNRNSNMEQDAVENRSSCFNRNSNMEQDAVENRSSRFNRNSNKEQDGVENRSSRFNRNSNMEPENGDGRREDGEQDAVENRSSPELPTFPDSVYAGLPDFFKKVVAPCLTDEERDIMLMGALVTVSSCLPKVFGIYDRKQVYANLFLFITAKASAGKGLLVLCKNLAKPVHWELRKHSHTLKLQYEAEMREYNLMKMKDFNAEKPVKPPDKMLLLPANNSTTGVFQLLSDNDGKGLIFETEGDTLAQAFKSDYGNYSDGFRKAFHHESISYYRRTDREFVEIEEPCLSAVLSGTPKQISTLIPSAENGLFSRFIFYYMNMKVQWKDVLDDSDEDNGLKGYYIDLGKELLSLNKALNENPAIKFCVSPEQHAQFNVFFSQLQDKYLMLQGIDYIATVRRLGLIAYRIAMVFTTLRILESGDFSEKQVCSDTDFQAALSMVRILVRHASHVYSELPEEVAPVGKQNKKEQFLNKLPARFTRLEFIEIAKNLTISQRTAELYISTFCDKGLISREQKGFYINLAISEK